MSLPTWAHGRRVGLKLPAQLGRPIARVSRQASSAPAVGSATMHAAEQRALIEAAFAPIAGAAV